MDIESIPQDEAHAKYRTAMVHMKKHWKAVRAQTKRMRFSAKS